MARQGGNSMFGGFSGVVGTVVLYRYRNLEVMRSRPKKRDSSKDSHKQRYQQQIFGYVSAFLQRAKPIINQGYQMPEKSAWTSMTRAISWHMENALIYTDGAVHFVLEKLKLSWPVQPTQKLWNPSVAAEPGSVIRIAWELNDLPQWYTSVDDEVCIAVYEKERSAFRFNNKVLREAREYAFTFPWMIEGEEIYVYLFARSSDGKRVSETVCLGGIAVVK